MSKQKNQRWTKEYAREVLARLEQSSKSDTEMAKELGVKPSRIWQWRNRLRGETMATTAPKPAFVEVAVARQEPRQPFAIHTHSGRTVTVWPGFDANELSRVLAVVETSPC